jgi:murein L,D-transpeptidase YcbB/YkuD
MPLVACASFAAALTVVASGPVGAQSMPGKSGDAGSRIATAPQPTTVVPAASEAATVRPLDPVPSETLAPVPAEAPETKMPAAQETPAAAPVETTAPVPTETPAAARIAEIDPVVAQVREQLAKSKLRDSTAAERTALTAFYADRNAPVWATTEGLTARARHAMSEIAKADDWGLDADAFALPKPASGDLSPEAAAEAELTLSVAVLKYARHARGGRLDPSQVSRNFDQKLSLRDPKVVLETVAGLDTPGSYLRALHPQHPQFELLRQALLKARGGAARPAEETVVQLPDGPTLRLGMQHPDVALLRQRLKLSVAEGPEDVYDQQVLDAVMEYQRKNGMRPDGLVGGRTRAALNGTDKSTPTHGSEEQRLIVNMERWRWMPEDMGEFHVWDNIPEYQTRVLKNGRVIHQAKIIVGKPETQTTIFSANMKHVIFGPEWGVPDSIKVKELLPYLRPTFEGPSFFGFSSGGITDTRVLERHNLRVSYNGKPVDPSQIDWREVDIRRYAFIQPSGAGNVLGAVKFRFPNKHDIYMHDTPQRELFDRTARTFSHGCVRVQDPGRFAEVLLEEDKGWSSARVRDLMERGGNNDVVLSKEIPVHITYFTAVASEDGQVRSFGDVYGHDRRVAAALLGRPMPLEAAPTLSVEGFPTKQEIKEARRQQRYNPNQDPSLPSSGTEPGPSPACGKTR